MPIRLVIFETPTSHQSTNRAHFQCNNVCDSER
jgi:hypothetical protein